MFLTDIPQFEEQMAMTVCSQVWPVKKKAILPADMVYTIHAYGFNIVDDEQYSVYENFGNNNFSAPLDQINLINLANIIFAGSKPLGIRETEILNKAFRKSFSQVPTKL